MVTVQAQSLFYLYFLCGLFSEALATVADLAQGEFNFNLQTISQVRSSEKFQIKVTLQFIQ